MEKVDMLQRFKHYLVGLGPNNRLTQLALALHARRVGYRVDFSDPTRIWLIQGKRRTALARKDLTFAPIMMECMNLFFESLIAKEVGGFEELDFSQPAFHTYRRSGMGFFFPSIPEEDPIDQYTYWYEPKRGDILWDAGAYAGATTCLLAKLVGPEGKVYAFEPDDLNFSYLQKNIEHHGLTNVITVRKALSGVTGTAQFYMGGTMASGIGDFIVYADSQDMREVPTLTMEDACNELGCVPDFVKMDIEGAELAFLRGAKEFLRSHPVHFAIESYHRVDGEYTYKGLEPIFREIGYKVLSSDRFQQMFTWAAPPL
jgi:FkbM family methyltransferase